jgi:hypothetical protein
MSAVMERQAWVRYPCQAEGPPASACTARACSISAHGLALALNREIEPGTVVSVHRLTPAGWSGDALAARVVHATAQEGGGWLVGCAWVSPVGEDGLRALA